MVDSVAQLDLIECRGPIEGAQVEVCIDLDAGLWMLDGRVRIGAKRSPIHTPEQAAALARAILARKRVRLVGIMAYESQIAGVGDSPPGRRMRGATIRALQRRSARELALRRAAGVAAVQEVLRVGGRRAAALRQRRRHGQPRADRRGAGCHRDRRRFRALRTDAVRRLPCLPARARRFVRAVR